MLTLGYSALGVCSGFFIMITTNAMRKLPLMGRPWEHVLAAGLGVAAFSYLGDWEVEARERLAEAVKLRQEQKKLEAAKAAAKAAQTE